MGDASLNDAAVQLEAIVEQPEVDQQNQLAEDLYFYYLDNDMYLSTSEESGFITCTSLEDEDQEEELEWLEEALKLLFQEI